MAPAGINKLTPGEEKHTNNIEFGVLKAFMSAVTYAEVTICYKHLFTR